MRRLLAIAISGLGCATHPPPAQLVILGALQTMDDAQPEAQGLAIADGVLVAVGSREAVLRHEGPDTVVVDVGDATVLPGFVDGHVHPVTGGIELGQCDLNGLETASAVADAITTCAERPADSEWIVGGGWDLTLYPDANPTATQLDAIVADRPVYLTAADAHSAWVNTEGLLRAGIDASTPDPADGRIERDADGNPTGTLREAAMKLVDEHLPPPTDDDHVAGLERGLAMARGFGITSLQEANADARVLAAYETLAARDALTARVVVAQHVDPERGPEQLAELAKRRDAIEHPRLRASSIKLFADGVIEGGTAALLQPYVGRDDAGTPVWTEDELHAMVQQAERLGFDVHVHAIGDRAIRMTLDAFEAAIAADPDHDRRHTIAHLELVDPADIPRFAALGVQPNFQPLWAYADPYITDLTVPVLGPERSRWLYPIRTMLDSGAHLVAGSDWSVSSMNPLRGIEVAVTRRKPGAAPGPAFIPEEAVGLPAMLAAYTRAGAFLNRLEHVTGSLEVGKRADLVVLDRDLMAVPEHEIHAVEVAATLLDGEVIHGALPQ